MPPPDLEEGWCETGDPLLGLAVPGLGSKCGIIPGLRSGLAKVGLRTALAAPEPPNDTPPKLDFEAMDVCHNNYINGCYMWYMVNHSYKKREFNHDRRLFIPDGVRQMMTVGGCRTWPSEWPSDL